MGKPWKSRPYVESTKMEALIGNSHRLLIGSVDPAGRDSVLPPTAANSDLPCVEMNN